MRKRILAAALALALLSGLWSALAAGGADDPLVSVSYLYDTVFPPLLRLFQQKAAQQLEGTARALDQRLDGVTFPEASGFDYAGCYTPLSMQGGGSVALPAFGCFFHQAGIVRLRVEAGEVLDLSTGQVCADGVLLTAGHRYFAAEDSAALLRSYSDDAAGMVDGYYRHAETGDIPVRERFLDVDEDHWAAAYIWSLAASGVVQGVDRYAFAPGSLVTRGAFVTILGRLCGVREDDWRYRSYNDVFNGDWYGPYVTWASENGIVGGYGDGRFGPGDPITREQMAAIILRCGDYLGLTLEPVQTLPPTGEEPFADMDKVSGWASEAVRRVWEMGLMNGKDGGVFDPLGTATRAEICAVASRFGDMAGLVRPVLEGDIQDDT